jgi:hypothetical protein
MPSTQVTQRQIKDGAINDAKIQAGANIASNKLADGVNFIKKDGTVVMTGVLDSGNNRIQNVATPTAVADAVNKAYADAIRDAVATNPQDKGSVVAGSTTSIVVSNPGFTVLDGITLVVNDFILLKDQSAPAENGIYKFNGSAVALTRAVFMDTWLEVPGAITYVIGGTVNNDRNYRCTSNPGGTLGTTAITWTDVTPGSGGLANSNFVNDEVPSGTVNGVNVTFTIANTPVAGSVEIYVNGIKQKQGASDDFTNTTTTITFTAGAIPQTGDVLLVNYRK